MLWRQEQVAVECLTLQRLGARLPHWKYTSLDNDEHAHEHAWEPPSLFFRGRNCLHSKIVWRILLVTATLLLLANVTLPTGHKYGHYGWSAKTGSEDLTQEIDWSRYAYAQYVTNDAYLCNSIMIFTSLRTLGVRADLLMMHPDDWSAGNDTVSGRLLLQASELGVSFAPVRVQHLEGGDSTWADSFTKLLAFNQTQYKRVIHLDSDGTVLGLMDELFFLPPAPVAMPRAYWLEEHTRVLSSQLVLIEPSAKEFDRILDSLEHRTSKQFDMEIINDLYGDSCFIIPHRRYDLLTGELKADDHSKYLGSSDETWDVRAIMNETKFVHFSDWPHPKPWLPASDEQRERAAPECTVASDEALDCRNRDTWYWLYEDFHRRRVQVCGDAFEST
ncbi:hypothetical protein LTR56_000887 [Elasticomyces elasticus]|nr:hypothetical protein LTR56_000887 [Elasticomyces elasticus]KAK3665461.1 hypothetical protein LTR22_003691 [Elasticomyces elasticus]KAK4929896.1 hypothetical protein LTR49_003523 [Elasticomyces elasticus]KAK5769294.1 hypothetical protein LTS12_000645 [Elasticomyces elasticus]